MSKKYDELVCTAGILDDGSWVRIYPLPFRKLEYENRYKKYQWLEIPLQTEEEVKREFSIVDKLPYKFFYRFRDSMGKESKLLIEDWEIGALYWNCLKKYTYGDEQKAIEMVKQKYFNEFSKKDIYLFLGTTKQFHGWAKNPFVIVGVFYPPQEKQKLLF